MKEVTKKGDLGSLIKELEGKQSEGVSTVVSSKSGYISVEEAAEILEMEPNTVRKMMRRGEFRTTRIGRRKYINADDAARYHEKAAVEEAAKMADPNRLLTVSEVAKLLRFSEAQVYDMLNKKILLGFRIGAGAGSWRVQKSDLDDYIVEQRTQSLTK
jgi:excisionase family DNA binding protein